MPAFIITQSVNFRWFIVGFLVCAAIERLYERRYSTRAARGEREDELVLRCVSQSAHRDFSADRRGEFLLAACCLLPVTLAGLVLFVVAVAVRVTAIRALGRFWSLHLEIRQDHQLITEGIYGSLRHPAYLAIMLEVGLHSPGGQCLFHGVGCSGTVYPHVAVALGLARSGRWW